jgi:hypothetical protein
MTVIETAFFSPKHGNHLHILHLASAMPFD